MALEIMNQPHLDRVLAFALETRQFSHLLKRLWYLHTYADHGPDCPEVPPTHDLTQWASHVRGKSGVQLHYDSAPASFYLVWTGLRSGMNGGLIYHGNQAGWSTDNVYVDPFSVQLCPDPSGNPWQVHT